MSEQRPEDVTPHVCDSPHLDLCTRPGHKEILYGGQAAMSDEFHNAMEAEFPPSSCRHCGAQGLPGEDHTCPCPYTDADCPDHPGTRENWIFGRESACRLIAATAWPWEAADERDSWAHRIGEEPEFGRKELARARERLEQAADALGLTEVER